MGRWMFILPHESDSNAAWFRNVLIKVKSKCKEKNVTLATHEKPYVLYLVVSDYEDEYKRHVSFNESIRKIYELSREYDFNYDIIYRGRSYYNKLSEVTDKELIERIFRHINFIKPDFLFLKDSNVFNHIDDVRLVNINNYIEVNNRYGITLRYPVAIDNFFTLYDIFSVNGLEVYSDKNIKEILDD